MTDNISFVDNSQLEEKIQMIVRQTDYSYEVAESKLKDYNYDHLAVIKNYFGITEKKEPRVKNVNQEIYRQIRFKLDKSMREYNERKEKEENNK
jgi:hypothetical protein